jgi:hypothetical protein
MTVLHGASWASAVPDTPSRILRCSRKLSLRGLCIDQCACAAALPTVRDGAITMAVSVSHERDVLAFDTAGT